ncbi:MAG TPA: YdeI/OmpD-associated family protein [Acidimicrobiales bacterium]|nr:YdeI/OmpD-associated family protein [Acidimicrobiales bacterium]
MADPLRFTAALRDAGGGGAAFDVPATAAAALGEAKRPPVVVMIGGHGFRTRVAVYGGRPMIGVSKANRAAAGIAVGDRFAVALALDTEPRTVTVPDDLAAALAADAEAGAAFDRLSFSHRREYVTWIEEAKRPETRARRVAGTLDRLRAGDRRSPQ